MENRANDKVDTKKIYVHETSILGDNAIIGNGSKIWHFSTIFGKVGENCTIGQNCFVSQDVTIGNGCKIQNNVSVYSGLEVHDKVFIGPSAVFTNVINPRAFIERKSEFKKTILKEGCSIGANSTILCGVTIGKYAIIGAGALVTKDVPDFAVIVNHNQILRYTDENGN